MSEVRRLVAPALATLAVVLICGGLGVWQVERLSWKEGLIATVKARLKETPVPAPEPGQWKGLDLTAMEYTPVKVAGHFDNDREIDVFTELGEPKGRAGGIGYLIFTPLTTDEGWTVFVNRGFVPSTRKAPASRPDGEPSGRVEVAGLFRQPEARHWYSPRDSVADNIWYTRDPEDFAAASDIPPSRLAPFLIDAFADPSLPGGLPQGGETIVEFPNSHLGYAITWFGLALTALGVFVAFARGRVREGRAASQGSTV